MATTAKTNSKGVQPKKRQPVRTEKLSTSGEGKSASSSTINNLIDEKTKLLKEVEFLRTELKKFFRREVEKKDQCPKCQILHVLENADLSESQINSVMRDVNNEIQESRMRRANRFTDEARFAQDKAMSFEADCNSHEPYN